MKNPLNLSQLFVASLLAFGSTTMSWAATELAKVNNSVITLEDFEKKYKENLKFFQFRAPTKKSVLDDLVKRELGIQEAKKLGLDKDPAVIDQMNTVLYHALLEKQLSKQFENIQISDSEAKSWYSKHPEIRTSHIFVAVGPNAKPDEEKKAQEKINKIYSEHVKSGEMSFAEVAQKYSEGVAAPMGGDIDYQTREKLDPKYYDTAFGLGSPGKISSPIRSSFGWHIIKLTGIHSWDDVDKAAVKRAVFDERRTQIFDRYMADLRQKAKVSVNSAALKE